MNNAQLAERQKPAPTPEQIVSNFIFAAEPIALKKTLNEMFFGCLASENEILTDERHQLLHLYNILNVLFEGVEKYDKSRQ